MKGFHRLRIDCDGPLARDAHVWLDGNELHCRSLRLDLIAGRQAEINRAYIEIDLDHIEVTADAIAMLQAHVVEDQIGDPA